MIFSNLVVKAKADDYFQLINITNESDAIVGRDVFDLLVALSQKATLKECSVPEQNLLELLGEELEIYIQDGVEDLVIRSGALTNLEFYITNACNLRCKHCYFFAKGKHERAQFLDLEVMKRTILRAEEMGMYRIKLCGGEPLFYDRMEELIHFLNTRKIGVTVISNGLLLHRYVGLFDPLKVSFVISLDGFAPAHDYLRGAGTFDRTVQNIKDALARGFDVSVNMVVYDRNKDDVEVFTDFVIGMGVRVLNVQVVRPKGMASEHLETELVADEDFLRDIHQNELEDQAAKIACGERFCTSCTTGLTIDFDGSVIGCPFLEQERIGNVIHEDIESIYQRSIRENPLRFVPEKAECLSCPLFGELCAGGCRARAQKVVGSMYACDYWIPFLLNHPKFKESPRPAQDYLLI